MAHATTARSKRGCGRRAWLIGFVAVLVALGALLLLVGPSPSSYSPPHRRSKGRHAILPNHHDAKRGSHPLLTGHDSANVLVGHPATPAMHSAAVRRKHKKSQLPPTVAPIQIGADTEAPDSEFANVNHRNDRKAGGDDGAPPTTHATTDSGSDRRARVRVVLPQQQDVQETRQTGHVQQRKKAAYDHTSNGKGKGKERRSTPDGTTTSPIPTQNYVLTRLPNRTQVPLPGGSEDALPPPRTYDDIIQRTLDRKYYVYPTTTAAVRGGNSGNAFTSLCDDVQVPFSPSVDERCIAFISAVAEAASQAPSLPAIIQVAVPGQNGAAHRQLVVNVSFDVLQQRFEQRTIKFQLTFAVLRENKHRLTVPPATQSAADEVEAVGGVGSVVRVMLKVPQVLFPIEPFAEVTAFELDRKLRIHRVPPTALVALPIAWIKARSLQRAKADMHMVPEFLEASHVASYDEWIDKDFVAFVSNPKVAHGGGDDRTQHDQGAEGAQHHSRFVKNGTHVWCSLQLFMKEVQPILYSPLRVPYSKSNPGWHRWFDVEFHEYPVAPGPLYGLSQLAIFDCIIMNNDRSPNKNNFVVGGCKKCDVLDRRPSGLPPTLVHLDHGMSFYGKGFPISHNPLGKVANKVRFCIFYAPLVVVLRRLNDQVGRSEEGWRAFMLQGVNEVAASVIGQDKVRDTGSQVVKVLKRLDYCLQQYNESVVLRP